MSLIRINRNPSRRQLNLFGVLWLGFFAIAGGIVLGKTGSRYAALLVWCMAVSVPAAGWIVPELMRRVYLGMAFAAWPIGFVVSHVVLFMVYFLVLTPIGLAMRCFGYDPMQRRLDPKAKTYWVPKEEEASVERYFRQF